MAMFARNDLCLLAPADRVSAGSAGALDALLKDGVKIGVSPAKIDPLGDYTVQLFDVADNETGSGAARRAPYRDRQSSGTAGAKRRPCARCVA
jgi:ABC-type molybdate transport system substrate-binding protein